MLAIFWSRNISICDFFPSDSFTSLHANPLEQKITQKYVFGYFEKLAIFKTIFKDELMKMKAEEAARVANLTKVRCRNF